MIKDSQIESLIEPVIKRQEKMNLDVLRRFGEKIKEIKEADSSDSASLFRMRAVQPEAKQLKEHIDRLISYQLLEIAGILATIAELEYLNSKYLYEYRKMTFIPFSDNANIQTVTSNIINQVRDIFEQLFKYPSFIIRDLQNPGNLVPVSIEDTYESLTNECIQSAQNKSVDYDTAMRRTSQQLVNSGLTAIQYNDDGKIYTQRMTLAVRNNLLDGIKLIQQGINDEVGNQVEADGKELSAHHFSALDHEPFQGHQFTNENWDRLQSSMDFEDTNGQHFMGVERIIGVWNCRHFAMSIILGYSTPMYTTRQLQQFIEENHNGYTLPNGKHLTMYECTQRQRQYESRIRQAKEGLYFANITGDKILQEKYRARIADRTTLYETFSKECGLPINKDATELVTK